MEQSLKKNHKNLILDFTHSYSEDLKEREEFHCLDCFDIEESRLYCSVDSQKKIRDKIEPYGISGIHFIDSGDYHYITKIMTDFIKEPFILVLIDHHTDMQQPAFEGMINCGSWAQEVLKNHPFLKQLVLIGQNRQTLDLLNRKNKEKVIKISYEQLVEGFIEKPLLSIKKEYPIYLSLDEDVLNRQVVRTNWDQGEMTFDMLKNILQILLTKQNVIGIDLCGTYPYEGNVADFLEAQKRNDLFHWELYSYLVQFFDN